VILFRFRVPRAKSYVLPWFFLKSGYSNYLTSLLLMFAVGYVDRPGLLEDVSGGGTRAKESLF
jgi:hypothetical protein